VYHASVGGADAELSVSAQFDTREVAVHDARSLEPNASLDLEGFTLVPHSTEVADFYAPMQDWQAAYEAEISDLLLTATGAREIFIFDHTLRSDSSSVRGEHASREPATVIHNDYTDASAEQRLRDMLEERAEEWLAGRYAIVNVWRSVAGPVVTTPLACCDASSIAEGDLVASERRAVDRVGELELVQWNPTHRWYYYPEMTRDEALLIKTFDSAQDGHARRSIHTAFRNPLAPPDAAPRQSLESRTILRF
jgi:hypothetical protein